MRRMAKFVKDVKCGRLVYPAGTDVEPLYEHEFGWYVRVLPKGRPMFCVSGISRSDFEYVDGKE